MKAKNQKNFFLRKSLIILSTLIFSLFLNANPSYAAEPVILGCDDEAACYYSNQWDASIMINGNNFTTPTSVNLVRLDHCTSSTQLIGTIEAITDTEIDADFDTFRMYEGWWKIYVSDSERGQNATYGDCSSTGFYLGADFNTITPTITNTPTSTHTFTFTPTPTFTDTATFTHTSTDTFTFTHTPTDTFTFTHTPTDTFTFTHTPTDTFTSTYTFTPTNTFTFTNTPTETATSTPVVPTVISVSPSGGPNNDSSKIITISGTNFGISGTSVQLIGSSVISGSAITTWNDTTIVASFDLKGAIPGCFKVYVVNPSSGQPNINTSTCQIGVDDFVISNAPTQTHTATPTDTFTFTATPTDTFTFTATPTDTFTFTATPTDTFTFTATPTDTFTFTATPTDTFTFTHTPTETETPIIPIVTSVSPSGGPNNNSSIQITIGGSNFGVDGITVELVGPNTLIGQVNSWNDTQVVAIFDINQQPIGCYKVYVTNPISGQSNVNSNTCQNGVDDFIITSAPTQTATITPTNTNTYTLTFTNTFTSTPTETFTFTNTPTDTPTNTFTATDTFTVTHTPTNTFTVTNTATNTATNTPLVPIITGCNTEEACYYTNSANSSFQINGLNFADIIDVSYVSLIKNGGTGDGTEIKCDNFIVASDTEINVSNCDTLNMYGGWWDIYVEKDFDTWFDQYGNGATIGFYLTEDIATITYTPTATNTPTFTNTITFTHTPTDTFTFTHTPTDTFTFTHTPTDTFTFTYTPTDTFTFTHTPTNTFTPTNTPTPTNTFTPTNTPTFTNTFTITNTPTNTATNTPSYTATNTPTVTNTPTITNTPVCQVVSVILNPTVVANGYYITLNATFQTNAPQYLGNRQIQFQSSAHNANSWNLLSIALTDSSGTATLQNYFINSSGTYDFRARYVADMVCSPSSTSNLVTNITIPAATATPTNTSVSATETVTNTRTITNTPTHTNTPTFTYTPSQTSTPAPTTNTLTPTQTNTPRLPTATPTVNPACVSEVVITSIAINNYTATFTIDIAPDLVKPIVVSYRETGTTNFYTLLSGNTNSSGTFSKSFTFRKKGIYDFRASCTDCGVTINSNISTNHLIPVVPR